MSGTTVGSEYESVLDPLVGSLAISCAGPLAESCS